MGIQRCIEFRRFGFIPVRAETGGLRRLPAYVLGRARRDTEQLSS